jgi:hypothetical protein
VKRLTGVIVRAFENEQGQSLVIFALFLIVMMGMAGMVVDVGQLALERAKSQTAADAAAWGGALVLPDATSARAIALDIASQNGYVQGVGGTTITRVTPYGGDANKIQVTISRSVNYGFSRVLGLTTAIVTTSSVAWVTCDNSAGAASGSIIALNKTMQNALTITNSGSFTVGGAIMDNSEHSGQAGYLTTSGTFIANGGINSVGKFNVTKSGTCTNCTPVNMAHFNDPFKDVPPPCFPGRTSGCTDVGGLIVRGGTEANPQKYTVVSSTPVTLYPGIYYGGIDITSSGGITFNSGTYILAGGGLKITASGTNVSSPGLFIYNTNDPGMGCSSPCNNGKFGPVTITVSGANSFLPMSTGPFANLLLFQDRGNTSDVTLTSSGAFGQGTIYAAGAKLSVTESGTHVLQMVADNIPITTSGTHVTNFDSNLLFHGVCKPHAVMVQ